MQEPAKKPLHYILWKTYPGGAESLVTAYIDRFSKERAQYLYSLRESENKLSDLPDLHFQSGFNENFACYRAYFQYCRRYRKDKFHLVNCGPMMLFLTFLAGVRRPVYHIHGTKYWKTRFEKLYLKTAWWLCYFFKPLIIANSKYSARIFQQKVLPITPRVIYNGFYVNSFLAKRKRRTELNKLAYVGRLHPGKNVKLTLRLFEEIAGSHPQLELHLAGTGMLQESLEDYARKSPYGDRIIFHGWVGDMVRFYAGIDLFIFPSAHESFGNVVLEALLTGLPVLASDIPAFAEIHGGDPAFSLGDPSDYEQAKANFLHSVEQYPVLAEKAYAIGCDLGKKFDMERHLDAVGESYEM